MTSSRSGNAADARPPRRPAGLPARQFHISYPVVHKDSGAWKPAANVKLFLREPLASLGTCAGIYVLGFCRQRGIPVEGIRLIQHAGIHPVTGLAEIISLDIQLPPDFPEKYKAAVIRAAEQCKVKKHFENPPEIEVGTSIIQSKPV